MDVGISQPRFQVPGATAVGSGANSSGMRIAVPFWCKLRTFINMALERFSSLNMADLQDSMKKFGSQTATFFSRAKQVCVSSWQMEWILANDLFSFAVHGGAAWQNRKNWIRCKVWIPVGKGREYQTVDRKTGAVYWGRCAAKPRYLPV